jgi:hypothetical protein
LSKEKKNITQKILSYLNLKCRLPKNTLKKEEDLCKCYSVPPLSTTIKKKEEEGRKKEEEEEEERIW